MKLSSVLFALFFTVIILSGCGVVEAIFKAGMIWAFILVGIIVFFLIYLIVRVRRK